MNRVQSQKVLSQYNKACPQYEAVLPTTSLRYSEHT